MARSCQCISTRSIMWLKEASWTLFSDPNIVRQLVLLVVPRAIVCIIPVCSAEYEQISPTLLTHDCKRKKTYGGSSRG